MDITSPEYHKKMKKYYLIFCLIRLSIYVFVVIGIVNIMVIFIPFVKGDEELNPLPFTLSQLESLLIILFLAFMLKKFRI